MEIVKQTTIIDLVQMQASPFSISTFCEPHSVLLLYLTIQRMLPWFFLVQKEITFYPRELKQTLVRKLKDAYAVIDFDLSEDPASLPSFPSVTRGWPAESSERSSL